MGCVARIGRLVIASAVAMVVGVVWSASGVAPVAHATPPTPTLTLDIETSGEGSNPIRLTRNGTKVYFAADDGVHGVELWMVDGAAAPVMVSDIIPGAGGSNPRNLAVVNGTLWFNAEDGTHGAEPWTTDGTALGTVMVADIFPGVTSSNPDEFVAVDGQVYFAAQDQTFGRELWRSDGTSAGTVMSWNLRAGTASSSPTELTVIDYGGSVGQRLWVVAEASGGTASAQRELVTVDGFAGGVDPITIQIVDRAPRELTALGTSLYLVAEPTSTTSGFDATTLHRVQLNGAGPPATFTATSLGATNPFNLTAVGTELYFTAIGASEGAELFHLFGGVPDLVADIRPGSIGSDPSDLTPANATSMYFVADDGTHGRELWRATNGVGVTLVADLVPGEEAAIPGELRAAAGAVVFAASTASGREPWYFSGTGTPLIMEDINPGAGDSTPHDFVAVIGVGLFFAATDPVAGNELTKVPLPFDVNATNRERLRPALGHGRLGPERSGRCGAVRRLGCRDQRARQRAVRARHPHRCHLVAGRRVPRAGRLVAARLHARRRRHDEHLLRRRRRRRLRAVAHRWHTGRHLVRRGPRTRAGQLVRGRDRVVERDRVLPGLHRR